MRSLPGRIKTFTAMHGPFWLGAALSCTVGAVFYAATVNLIEKDATERFNTLVHSVHHTLLGRVKTYADVLRGTASMFQASPELTREQFHRYVEGLHLDTEFPGIEAINYARKVTDAERPAFEQRMRAELSAGPGAEPFRITPPGRRAEYLVLTYIEPSTAAVGRVGLDLHARPSSIPHLDNSRDSGGVSSSGLPIPMRRSITGLGMRLPIYRPEAPIATVAQRRAAYTGSVGIGFSVERLMAGVLTQLPVQGMRLSLVGTAPGERPGQPQRRFLLYDSGGARDEAHTHDRPTGEELALSLPIDYNKSTWYAQFRIQKSNMLNGIDTYVPWLAMLAGVVSTSLLYALFHALSSSRRHALGLADEMTRELRASESNLQKTNAKLRQLAAHAEYIKEGERKRIAREIHDDLGQNLLALRIEADLLASRTGDRHPLLHSRAVRTVEQIDATIRSVRQIINDLRPNVLDLGLNAAVDWQIAQFRHRTGIACDLVENDQDIKVSDRCATALFRILQESLTNISRHARATQARVELYVERDTILMSISDNGVGLRQDGRHKQGSFGLVGIEERVHILGGKFVIASGPEGGTRVSVTVPLVDRAQPLPRANATEANDTAQPELA